MKPVLFSSKQLYWRQHCHYSVQCWFSSKSPLHSHTSQNHCSNYMNLINMESMYVATYRSCKSNTLFFQCCLFIPQFHDWKCSLATHWLVNDIYHIVTIILSWKTEISLFLKSLTQRFLHPLKLAQTYRLFCLVLVTYGSTWTNFLDFKLFHSISPTIQKHKHLPSNLLVKSKCHQTSLMSSYGPSIHNTQCL